MLTFLKNHPFAVAAFFESSVTLTFALPADQLRPLLPSRLEPDTHHGIWGFVAVAMVQAKALRPKGFPTLTGQDFFLAGYRIFSRYRNKEGRNLRGLYILRSETDRKRMEFLGNLFTRYKYTAVPFLQTKEAATSTIHSPASGFRVCFCETKAGDTALPADSVFADWKEARRFAGPLPFTFSCDPAGDKVLIVEGVRENWQPSPVTVLSHHIPVLDTPQLAGALLASAFIVRNIPYHWKKGKTEQWSL